MPIKRATGTVLGQSLAAAVCAALLNMQAGCASEQPVDFSSLVAGGGYSAPGTIEGRYRDLDAVIRYSCGQFDMAVVELIQADGGDRAYRIRTINDEPVWLVIASGSGWDDPRALLQLDLSAKVGRFGDRERERDFITLIRDRLAYLAERDTP